MKITITIGAQLDYTGAKVSQPERKRDEVMRRLAHQFGGVTVFETIGAWIDENGTMIQEKGYRFECLAESHNEHLAHEMAQLGRITFKQHSVVLEVDGKAYFVADESEYFTTTQGGI